MKCLINNKIKRLLNVVCYSVIIIIVSRLKFKPSISNCSNVLAQS